MMMTGPHDKRDIQTHQVIVSIILHPYPFISETPLLSLFKTAMDLLGPGSVIIILFTAYQKKPPITSYHPSPHLHTEPDSPPIRKNLLSPPITPHHTYTLNQIHRLSEKTSYHLLT